MDDFNKSIGENSAFNSSNSLVTSVEEPTIGSLQGMTKRIYYKIKEQLEDSSHPLIMVITKFREEFSKDVMKQLETISSMNTHNL